MRVCSYCQENLPEDSEYCVSCGTSLKIDVDGKENEEEVIHRNVWASFGLFLFLITLIVFDGIGSLIFSGNTTVLIISIIGYIGVLLCSILALKFESNKKKKNKAVQGNYSLVIAQMVVSILMILINIQQLTLRG